MNGTNEIKTTKDVVIWLRGTSDEIDTNLIKDFSVIITDTEDNEHTINITRKDLEMLTHQTNGKFQMVFRKTDGIKACIYPKEVKFSTDFSNYAVNITINKLYFRTGLERYIKVIE